jgi:L-ribulose-5-phosphate 3-epimerase
MFLGYNTNGFAFHRLEDAVQILHEVGYGAVGITLDVHHLDPFQSDVEAKAKDLRRLLDRLGMRCVIETGARFLLDPRRKHQPTLVDPKESKRNQRVAFLEKSLDLSAILRADALSFWAGTPPDGCDDQTATERLLQSFPSLLEKAKSTGVLLALEPEPGMAVATTEQGMEIGRRVGDPMLGLTVDVGHVHCNSEGDIPTILKGVGDRLFNVHIEDMKAGVHDHLMFGEGEMDFPPIFEALRAIGYQKGVYVELSRHAHDAVAAATKAMAFLKPISAT